MNTLPDAVTRLQHSRERWLQTLEQDARARSAQPLGAVSGLLQGLGASPWQAGLSATWALWLAWRRRRAEPAVRPPLHAPRRWTPYRPLLLAGLVAALLAALWWKRRSASTRP